VRNLARQGESELYNLVEGNHDMASTIFDEFYDGYSQRLLSLGLIQPTGYKGPVERRPELPTEHLVSAMHAAQELKEPAESTYKGHPTSYQPLGNINESADPHSLLVNVSHISYINCHISAITHQMSTEHLHRSGRTSPRDYSSTTTHL
jgi:hypothetical protein